MKSCIDGEERPAIDLPIVLCADDYALTPGVSEGILDLAARRRVTAVSAMSTSACFEEYGRRLAERARGVEVGLHLVLTDQRPLRARARLAPCAKLPAIGALIRLAYVGGLPLAEVAAEIEAQFEHFMAVMGCPPDFVDGHQHAHLLPGIRSLVLEVTRATAPGAWIRNCADRPEAILRHGVARPKAALIAALSAGMRAAAERRGLRTNPLFRGVIDYEGGPDLAHAMPRFLGAARPGLLVMCHPGKADEALIGLDLLVTARERELAYLAGPQFERDLGRAGCRLASFDEAVCAAPV